jgi:hypothetical protein
VIEALLSRQIDDLEPKLMRHGYDVRILANQFNAKTAEIRQFLQGALDADRTGSSRISCWRPACSRRAASDLLTERGSMPMISGWSHGMWVPSQIMWVDVQLQSQLIWAKTRYDLAPKLR